jgi:oligoendopeptidase F
MEKREIAWNLSEIFPSPTDPTIQEAIDDLHKLAENFASKYQRKIKDLSASDLLKCVEEYEVCRVKLEEIVLYATLSFAANMTPPDIQSLYDRANTIKTRVEKVLAFLSLK